MKRFFTFLSFSSRLKNPLWIVLLVSIVFSKAILASGILMIDLTQPNEHQQWRATNDNVMGGISEGGFSFDGKAGLFSGELSLENNGGFSSVNRPVELPSGSVNQVEIEFIGDGRPYQLRLTTWKNGYRTNYKHDFSTIKGQKLSKVFNLNDFQAVYRGRLLDDAPELVASDIKQIGLLIADKQAGPFSLSLIEIRFKTPQENE